MTDLPPFYAPITDPSTAWRLWLRYSPQRATEIIAGRDLNTAIDINAWRNLGAARCKPTGTDNANGPQPKGSC